MYRSILFVLLLGACTTASKTNTFPDPSLGKYECQTYEGFYYGTIPGVEEKVDAEMVLDLCRLEDDLVGQVTIFWRDSPVLNEGDYLELGVVGLVMDSRHYLFYHVVETDEDPCMDLRFTAKLAHGNLKGNTFSKCANQESFFVVSPQQGD